MLAIRGSSLSFALDFFVCRAKIDHLCTLILRGRNTTRNNQSEMSCYFVLILLFVVQKETLIIAF